MLDKVHVPVTPARPVLPDAKTLPEMLRRRAQLTPDAVAFRVKDLGAWVQTTWQEFNARASAIASWLLDQGLATGDKLTIVGSTRPEWCLCDFGGLFAGAVTVGAYPTLTAEQLAYILDHSDSRFAFVEDYEQLEKIIERRSELPKLEKVAVWNFAGLPDAARKLDWVLDLADVLRTDADEAKLTARAGEVKPEATAIIVYTSGTTGPPKGAMISHQNITTVLSSSAIMDFDADDCTLSFLPMAHVAERVLAFYGRINFGTATAYASSIPAVLEEIKEVRPTIFGSVPRIFEKAYAKIQGEVAKAPPGKQKVFRWAEATGLLVVQHWQRGEDIPFGLKLKYKIADRLVFSKLRGVFGGRVKFFITGAAPTPRKVLEFFWSAGFPIYEVYGMTEATVISHANRPGQVRLGSVGKALSFVEDKLAEDGEILVRGKTVFQGYYKAPEATAEMIDAEGWLHTGDVGRRDADGYLAIVDRKKHIIITAGGKNLTPANIENEIKMQDPLISQVHAHGDARAYVTALVTLSPMECLEWAKEHGHLSDDAALERMRRALMENPLARPDGLAEVMKKVSQDKELQERIVKAVRSGNVKLSRVEQVKRIFLLDRELSPDEDEITPTLKVKRKNLEKKFAPQFERLYEDASFGIVVMDQ